MPTVRCPGCGLEHPAEGAPRPDGLRATGECHADAGARTVRFYAEPDLVPARQWVVDAYACQHPDPSTRVGVQRTALCLMTLDLFLEVGLDVSLGATLHAEMVRVRTDAFTSLEPPDLSRALTHHHLDGDGGPVALAREWASSVWRAWHEHHGQVREWNERLVPDRLR